MGVCRQNYENKLLYKFELINTEVEGNSIMGN
jgi:hypothetical protein